MAKSLLRDHTLKDWGKISSIIVLLLILASASGVGITTAQQTSEFIDIRIASSSDDVEEKSSDGMMYMDSSDLELGVDADWYGDHIVGLRFQNVIIPSGATVLHAYLEFETDETWNTVTIVEIRGQAANDATAFTTANYDLSSRSTTTASVNWDIPAWNTVNEKHQSPDISEVIQEVVDRVGWISGNGMVFMINGTGTRTAEAFDGEPEAAPLLHVEYTIGEPTPTPNETSTGTPTYTLTPSPSLMPSDTPTGTPTDILTQTPTPILSDTPTPTPVLEPTGLLVYPYLGETTTTTVIVSWATDRSGNSEVRYSLDQSYNAVIAAVDYVYDGKHWHSATITGLSENTTYFYKVFSNDQDLTPWSEITFTTAPNTTISPFTFVALGDSRSEATYKLPNPAAWDVVAEMERHNFGLAIHAGDIIHSGGICSGSDSSWNQYIRTYFDLYQEIIRDIPFYPSIGGHELVGGTCGYQAYTDVYQLPMNAPSGYEEQYYSFNWGNTHFIALDVVQNYATGSPQYNWLVSDLQSSTETWKVIIFHDPPYSSGVHGGSSDIRNHLVPVFEAYGVDIVFNGHDHTYERTCPILNDSCSTTQEGGVVYFITGGAGASLYDVNGDWFTAYAESIHHFIKVEVDDCRMQLDAINTEGIIFDSYEINHCGGLPTSTPSLTPSDTPTATPTSPLTPTPTPSDMPTSTPTPSLTATLTSSPAPTLSPTPSDTLTPTAIPSDTPTPSPTPSDTPTATPTTPPLPSPSPTPSDMPTSTPTPSLTATLTSSPAPTLSPTPSDTLTPTAIPSDTPTPSPTPSDTPTATPTATPLPSPSPTPSSTHTPTSTPAFTATPSPAPTGTPTPTPTFSPTPSPTSNALIYLSSTTSGSTGGVPFDDEDILVYDTATDLWSLYFDGSDIGLNRVDISAFALMPDGSILMSFNVAFNVPGLGTVDDSDIVQFTPISTGVNTAGSFSLYLIGADIGLTKNSEDIDAIGFTPDSRLVISTIGSYSVTGASGNDEDLLVFNTDSNSLSLYFDGSDVGFNNASSEDINGVCIDPDTNQIYLTAAGSFAIPGISSSGEDIFICTPGSLGTSTSCTFQSYWIGSLNGFAGEVVDGIEIVH